MGYHNGQCVPGVQTGGQYGGQYYYQGQYWGPNTYYYQMYMYQLQQAYMYQMQYGGGYYGGGGGGYYRRPAPRPRVSAGVWIGF
jgi:hypothetical protein